MRQRQGEAEEEASGAGGNSHPLPPVGVSVHFHVGLIKRSPEGAGVRGLKRSGVGWGLPKSSGHRARREDEEAPEPSAPSWEPPGALL